MSYTLNYCYVMYNVVSEIRIGGRFLRTALIAISNKLAKLTDVAKETLIPYNLIQGISETQNL